MKADEHPDDAKVLAEMAAIDEQLNSGTLTEDAQRAIANQRLTLMNRLWAQKKARKRNLTTPKQ